MNVSKLKIAWSYLTGGAGKVADYLLDILNQALAKVDPKRKETVAAVLNTALKVMGVLEALAWLVPTKWQRAYQRTLDAVSCVCICLEDMSVTDDELAKMRNNFAVAVAAWRGPDDASCVTLDDCAVED